MRNPQVEFTTATLGAVAGYSTQQVRDLERLGVLPPAERASNGYRRYEHRHESALRAYRAMATAIGPVPARRLMPELVVAPVDRAAERIDVLHAEIAAERSRVTEALRGLDVAVDEADDAFDEGDAMTIGELAQALGVRPSALRHWEREGWCIRFAARRPCGRMALRRSPRRGSSRRFGPGATRSLRSPASSSRCARTPRPARCNASSRSGSRP
ncbi:MULTISPECIES: MerR family DNA-binding transcriptional regulator [unclassified Microbacterium]|uniref:MerR family DNA-binding transcriptional regulator n=1 Tax=unclassified Microbacterium TaxID=2609290 RepID=UPI001FCF07D0|nr:MULTISPECIES: MerR family DNA-binding transcriptional regulator [unclassified Microbacterium]